MSALLATHTAIRVARDVGYPQIEPPVPPQPAIPLEPPLETLRFEAAGPKRAFSDGTLLFLIATAVALAIISVVVWLDYLLN